MKVSKISDVPSEAVNTPLFTGGEVSRQTPFLPDDFSTLTFGVVSFGSGARNKFHTHTSDQILIITSDNPRKEKAEDIIEDIKPGMRRGNYEVIVDRKQAIFKAVAMAQPRDIILIAGKGHETYQEFADHTAPFDDAAVAREALELKRTEL